MEFTATVSVAVFVMDKRCFLIDPYISFIIIAIGKITQILSRYYNVLKMYDMHILEDEVMICRKNRIFVPIAVQIVLNLV
ncbi:hypothetical protein D3C85_1042480 [compost metagenome]